MKKYAKVSWLFHNIRWFIIRVLHVVTGEYFLSERAYGHNSVLNGNQGNEKIYQALSKETPFCYGRFGFVELDLMIRCKQDRIWKLNSFKHKKDLIDTFIIQSESKYEGILRYDRIMREALQNTDIYGIWKSMAMGDVYIREEIVECNKVLTDAVSVEPYGYELPWSYALKGKRVLVVSPFSETIKTQYAERRSYIFENKKILPDFELLTVDSIWYSAAGKDERFSNWFEAYDHLYDECMKIDFEVALLGCGPFGFPLAARLKMAGKQAIHMGGAVQILFGIAGKRWDNNGVANLYNEYWVRAPKETMPANAVILDKECYW